MAYDLYDFTESLERVSIPRDAVETVIAATGENGDYAEWSGGFLLKLKDGRYALVSGWCDTTGWGCQDGAYVRDYDHEPTREELDTAWGEDLYGSLAEAFQPEDFDETPADLNRFLVGEIDRFGEAASSPRLGVSESTDHSPIDQRMDSAPRTEQTGENR